MDGRTGGDVDRGPLPAIAIFVAGLGFGLPGDGLRDVLDPERGR